MGNGILQDLRMYWRVIVAASLGWVLDAFDFTILLFLIPRLREEFHVSLPQMALVIGATLWAKVIGNAAWGWLADRYGRKKPFIIGVVWFALFCGLTGLSWSYGSLLAFRILFGLGYGGEWSAAAPLLMESVPERIRGVASGIMMAGYEVGYLLAALAFGTVFPAFGWRWMFFLGALPALLAIFIRGQVRESPVWRATKGAPLRRGFRLTEAAVQGWCFMAAINFLSYAIFGLYPTFLTTVRHLAPRQVFPFVATYSVASIIGKPVIGQLCTRFGERPVLTAYLVLTIPGALLYTTLPGSAAMFVGAVLMGLLANSIFGLVPAYLARRFPTADRSFGMGAGYAIAGVTGALSPYLIALFTTQLGLAWAMALFIVIGAAAAMIAATFQPRSFPGDIGDPGTASQR